jgi:DNA-binding IclR family transcriptional regulator
LAFQPPSAADRIIRDCEKASDTPIDRAALEAQLGMIRSRGYELRESRDFVGITDICCPIFGMDGKTIASIIIAYVNRHTRESRHEATLSILRAACSRISGKLSPHVRRQ